MNIIVTGATGFVGKRLIEYDENRFTLLPVDLRTTKIKDLDLSQIDAVIHLAGKAHQMQPIADSVYFDVNYGLTRQLAEAAIQYDVPHFIYISSTKVYGDEVMEILDENSICQPTDAYGKSKWEAEQYLQSVQSSTFKVAIVRPPLVYGPEVKGNMLRLLYLADKKYPLPFGNSHNARSLVFVDNLIELINKIIERQAIGIFIAGDREALSTDHLIREIRKVLGNKKGLVAIPGVVRKMIKKIRPALYTRLFGSFVVDNRTTNQQLDFVPPYTTEQGIGQMVDWFKKRNKAL